MYFTMRWRAAKLPSWGSLAKWVCMAFTRPACQDSSASVPRRVSKTVSPSR